MALLYADPACIRSLYDACEPSSAAGRLCSLRFARRIGMVRGLMSAFPNIAGKFAVLRTTTLRTLGITRPAMDLGMVDPRLGETVFLDGPLV